MSNMDKFKGVVMIGNLSEGWELVGPFPTWEDACAWADMNIGDGPTWIMSMYSPGQYISMVEGKQYDG
jgi:hypothetical protein